MKNRDSPEKIGKKTYGGIQEGSFVNRNKYDDEANDLSEEEIDDAKFRNRDRENKDFRGQQINMYERSSKQKDFDDEANQDMGGILVIERTNDGRNKIRRDKVDGEDDVEEL